MSIEKLYTLADTHCHLFYPDFNDIHTTISNAVRHRVEKILLPNISAGTVEAMFNLCEKFPDNCFSMLGLHPCNVNNNFKADLKLIFDSIHNKKIVGIGEVGLDYYHDLTFKTAQQEALEIQFEIALQKKIPVSLHTRNATQDVITMVKKYKNLKGVFHCFGEDYDTAKQIIDLGFYLGIGGPLTFKNSTLPSVLKKIPLEYIVFETDAPYLAPIPHRGKRNEPAYIKIIAEKYAEICAVDFEKVVKQTTLNVQKIFKLAYLF